MFLEDRLLLLKAGYTKDEISQMEKPAPVQPDGQPVPAPAPAPATNPEPPKPDAPVDVPVPAPAPVPTPAPAPAPAEPTMQDVMLQIAKLTSAIQANAIANSIIPGGGTEPKPEDMLAQIIRPSYSERKEDK